MTREFHGQTVVVVGMGKSGAGAVELLLRHGARVRAVDENPSKGLGAKLAQSGVELVPQTPDALRGADLIVLSPGVPVEVVPHGAAPVIGEVELAGYYLQGPTIGITGSNGKTTTTALTGHILRESGISCQVGGNIGTAPTAMIDSSRPDQWNVLELSSFQLETIHEFRARVGVCLNVTQNHLDRHKTIKKYADAKARLVERLDPDGDAVLNRDNAITAGFAGRTHARVTWFSMREAVRPGFFLRGSEIVSDEGTLMDIREIRLRGMHNVENVMAAAAASRIAGARLEQIRGAVGTFQGVEHRIEFVRNLNGVDYYNDSKATSVDAALKAVDAFPGGLWIILGGKDKGSDYTVMRETLRRKAHAALLIGAAAAKIQAQLDGALPIIECGDVATAIQIAHGRATRGDTVLLAPACASFDQFRSFEHRGDVFKQIVRALEEVPHGAAAQN
jgi:UDP-N-acetylmuramoylalanine--D-glutamate ligase